MTTHRPWRFGKAGALGFAFAGWLPFAAFAHAGERQLDFLHALADRQYHDLAQTYLDRLVERSALPADLRDVLPYEEAILLLAAARSEPDLIRRDQQLELAREKLEAFIKSRPDHPRAANAGNEFGKILLERGRVALVQSQLPANRARRQSLREQARGLFQEARRTLETSQQQYEGQFNELTRQVNAASENDPAVIAERQAVDRHVMQAKLDRALAQYEFAQTFDAGSKAFTEAVHQAAGEFERIYVEYRTQIVGLYGRMWQGRCFQELGEPTKALGFYRELLAAGSGEQEREAVAPLARLRDNVLYFRLVSLNDPKRRDHAVVVAEAEPWRGTNARTLQTEVGLGIALELAGAYEGLALQKPSGSGERNQLMQRAARVVGEISRYGGQHQPVALAMRERLGAQNRQAEPHGFDALLDAARSALGEGFTAQGAADADAAAAHEHFAEALRFARQAVQEVRSETAVERVNEARLVLCHASYQLGRNYDAAVIGEFLGRRYPESGLAANAAGVALAAFLQEYQRPDNRGRDDDLAHLVDVANLIVDSWPETPEAERASMTLGGVYQQQGKAAEAAEWYLAIDPGRERYSEAQQKAGMAWWDAYLQAARLPRGERPEESALAELRRRAQEHLERGIDGAGTSNGANRSATLSAARLCLAQVYLEQSDFRESLALIEPLLRGVDDAGAAGSNQGNRFALEAYKAALRGYVGVHDLDAAERMMTRIESFETAGQAGVIEVYQRLGQELEQEVERRRDRGDEAGLAEMLAAFEAFLDRIAERRAGQTFESLAWTGDAYYRLAQGLDAGEGGGAASERARELFGKAANVIQRILDDGAAETDAAQASSLQAIRLRLAHCLRRRQRFAEALELVAHVLRANPRAVDAQREGAYVYQNWAEAEGGHWGEAMAGGMPVGSGEGATNLVWGWAKLAQLLQPSAAPGSPYYALWHEARYNQAYCRFQQAQAQGDRQQRARLLQLAQRDVLFTTRLTGDQGGPEWKAKFEALDGEIRQALARQ